MNGAFAKNLFSEPEHDAVARLEVALAGHRNRGCIGLDYVDMITATVDIAATGRLHPWDHAAGVLIHAEAGGHTALADGIIYRPDVSAGVMISAADENSWRAVRDVMYPDGNYPASG
jgi:fructose-1,6-bisphosphatase/inositol monophosphatase family enzyme